MLNESSRVVDEERSRVFCAVEITSEVRERALRHIARLRATVPESRASWLRPENVHLTLKFLGELVRSRVEKLSQAAARATESQGLFKLMIEGAGAFPTHGFPRTLWLGVIDPEGGLMGLQSNLEVECSKEGFLREERPFHPHLTLARIRAPQGARALAKAHRETGFEPIGFEVKDLVVLRSELGPGGSRYTEISRHPLKIQS